jgi:hypothetical protein
MDENPDRNLMANDRLGLAVIDRIMLTLPGRYAMIFP